MSIFLWVAALWLAAGQPTPAVARDTSRSEAVAEASKTAKALVDAIRKRDVARIMSFYADRGVLCGDALVPRIQVEKELRTPGTWVNSFYFDAAKFNAQYRSDGFPMSLAEFLGKAKDLDYAVEFPFPGPNSLDNPHVMLSTPELRARFDFPFARWKGKLVVARGPNCE